MTEALLYTLRIDVACPVEPSFPTNQNHLPLPLPPISFPFASRLLNSDPLFPIYRQLIAIVSIAKDKPQSRMTRSPSVQLKGWHMNIIRAPVLNHHFRLIVVHFVHSAVARGQSLTISAGLKQKSFIAGPRPIHKRWQIGHPIQITLKLMASIGLGRLFITQHCIIAVDVLRVQNCIILRCQGTSPVH